MMWQNLVITLHFQSSKMKGNCQKSQLLCYHHFLCMGQELSAIYYYPVKILSSLVFVLWRTREKWKEANRKSEVTVMSFSKIVSAPSYNLSPLFSWEKFKQHGGLLCWRERGQTHERDKKIRMFWRCKHNNHPLLSIRAIQQKISLNNKNAEFLHSFANLIKIFHRTPEIKRDEQMWKSTLERFLKFY